MSATGLAAPLPGRRATAAVPPSRITGVLFTLLLAAALAAAFIYLSDPRALPIRHVRVNGDFRHLSPAALQATASEVVRGGFFNVNVEAIRATLLAEPWVMDITVRRVWPDTLAVYVREQSPAARWGEHALLNRDAVIFTPAPASWPPGLVRLDGPRGTEALMLERYRYMQQALDRFELDITALQLSDRRSWSLQLQGGAQVILGRRDFVGRFERLNAMLGAGLAGELQRIEVMDMRYTNGLAVRWKQGMEGEIITGDGHGEKI